LSETTRGWKHLERMRITRVQFSLRRLMIVVAALGFNFGVLPWPASAVFGAAIALPLFVSSPTFIEWAAIYSTAAILAAASIPPVVTNCRSGRAAMPAASPSPITVPVGAPAVSVETRADQLN
jgi:hypothetical protein